VARIKLDEMTAGRLVFFGNMDAGEPPATQILEDYACASSATTERREGHC